MSARGRQEEGQRQGQEGNWGILVAENMHWGKLLDLFCLKLKHEHLCNCIL